MKKLNKTEKDLIRKALKYADCYREKHVLQNCARVEKFPCNDRVCYEFFTGFDSTGHADGCVFDFTNKKFIG